MIAWEALFSTREGIVESVSSDGTKVTVRRLSDGHRHTWTVGPHKQPAVTAGQHVGTNEILASAVPPVTRSQLQCPGKLPQGHIRHLISSRERTQRFSGIKLARLVGDPQFCDQVRTLEADPEEDVYVRLEAAAYLGSIGHEPARSLFDPYLKNADEQLQLEAVIALGETATEDAIDILCHVMRDTTRPYFLRSAAAWAASRSGSPQAPKQLVKCFADVEVTLRSEALEGLAAIGGPAFPALLRGLKQHDEAIAAGCAETLRRAEGLPTNVIDSLIKELNSPEPQKWAVWLIAHLPREQFATTIDALQHRKPQLHYAISLIWSFVESWIARNWELQPQPALPQV